MKYVSTLSIKKKKKKKKQKQNQKQKQKQKQKNKNKTTKKKKKKKTSNNTGTCFYQDTRCIFYFVKYIMKRKTKYFVFLILGKNYKNIFYKACYTFSFQLRH